MAHIIVTRFSVPRAGDPQNANRHRDREWLERRLDLFGRFFVPSVGRLDTPVILLCSSDSASHVARKVDDLSWVEVVVQDDWYGGWSGSDDQIVTRMDSDDAIHRNWFDAVDQAPPEAEVCCTRGFLRYDPARGRLCSYWRRHPSPLVAFQQGRNPFAHDHATLERHYRVHHVKGLYLAQIYHGGNVSTRRPPWYRPRVSLERLKDFGIS
jgi:hypothetical protein